MSMPSMEKETKKKRASEIKGASEAQKQFTEKVGFPTELI